MCSIIYIYICIHKCITIILINFVISTISFILNVENKTDSNNIELDNNNNNNNNNNSKNNFKNKVIAITIIMITIIQINKGK